MELSFNIRLRRTIMLESKSFCVSILVGDMRQVFMAETLVSLGYKVAYYGTQCYKKQLCNCTMVPNLKSLFSFSHTIITPVPFSKDGNNVFLMDTTISLSFYKFFSYFTNKHYLVTGSLPDAVVSYCKDNCIPFFDFMSSEEFAIGTAIPTAEGAILEALRHSSLVLHQNNALVLGFGRCGKVLASKLKGLDAHVSVCSNDLSEQAYISSYGYEALTYCDLKNYICNFQFIFNTVPALILMESLLTLLPSDVVIIDIASSPGGIDYEACKRLEINAHLCQGLPGKTAPKSAARLLIKELQKNINSH